MDFAAIQAMDVSLQASMQGVTSPLMTQFFQVITLFGDPMLWFMVAAFIYWQGKETRGIFIINLMLLAGLFVGLIKPLVGRARPPGEHLTLFDDTYSNYSFPSGHSTVAAAIFGYANCLWKTGLPIILFILMILVGVSRIYLGVHFPSDVVAGWVLGFILGYINFEIFKRIKMGKIKITHKEAKYALGLVVSLTLLGLFFLEEVAIFAAILGFYLGYIVLKEKEIPITEVKGWQLASKQVFGFAVFFLFLLPYLLPLNGYAALSPPIFFIVHFVGGLWISLLYPVLYEKLIKKYHR